MSWYYKLSIKTKLLVSFLAIIIFTLIISVSALMSMREAQQVASYVDWTLQERYKRVDTTLVATRSIQNELFSVITLTDPAELNTSLRDLDSARNNLKARADALQMGRFPQEIGGIKSSAQTIINTIDNEIVPIIKKAGKGSPEAARVYSRTIRPAFDTAFENLNKVRGYQIREVIDQVDSVASTTPMFVVMAITAFSIILSITIALSSAAYIKHALYVVITNIKYLGNRDFSHEVKLDYQDEFKDLGNSLESLRQHQASMMRDLLHMAEKISSDMSNAKQVVTRLSENASDSENRTVTLAAAADEMVSTTLDIARNCEQASNLAQKSNHITSDGMAQAKSSIEAIYNQAEQTKTNNKQIEAMINQSRSINSIVNTIDEIASQTNLLALNAAIEAARAGDAGRGFAVVADEVRALASRTSASTNEISQKVSAIEVDANITTESMDKAVTGMSTLADNTSLLEKALNEIKTHVEQVTAQITQIATAAEEQTTATHEISKNMQDLTNSTREVAQIAQNSQVIIANTNSEVERFAKVMREFKFEH